MDKIIVTVMLVIGGILASFALFNNVYPAVQRSGAAISTASDAINAQMVSDIKIIQVNENQATVDAWVKNTGTAQIDSAKDCDVFLGTEGDVSMIPFGTTDSFLPYWNYQIEGIDSQWMPSDTNDGRRQLLLPVNDNYICRFPSFLFWSFLLSGLRCWAAAVR